MAASTSHKIGGQLYTTESMLLHLLSRLDQARQRTQQVRRKRFGRHEPISLATMRYELCTFDLWRSIIAECLASFLYVFLLCSTHLTWNGSNFIFNSNTQPNWLIISLCSGFTMATLIHCFGHISGGHINPAVTISFLITKRISPLRTILYILAHCTGAIAGAALLYGYVFIFSFFSLKMLILFHFSLSQAKKFFPLCITSCCHRFAAAYKSRIDY